MVAVVDHVPGGVIAQWAAGHMIILVEFYTYRNSLVAELIQRLGPAIPVAIVSVFIVNARTRPGISHVVYQPVEVVVPIRIYIPAISVACGGDVPVGKAL